MFKEIARIHHTIIQVCGIKQASAYNSLSVLETFNICASDLRDETDGAREWSIFKISVSAAWQDIPGSPIHAAH